MPIEPGSHRDGPTGEQWETERAFSGWPFKLTCNVLQRLCSASRLLCPTCLPPASSLRASFPRLVRAVLSLDPCVVILCKLTPTPDTSRERSLGDLFNFADCSALACACALLCTLCHRRLHCREAVCGIDSKFVCGNPPPCACNIVQNGPSVQPSIYPSILLPSYPLISSSICI